MAITVAEDALSARPSPWPSRITVAAVHFFIMVLFLQNVREATWAAIAGFLIIHLYSWIVLRFWSKLERSTAGDVAIVALTLEYLLIAVLFWDTFSVWPWSTFFGLILVQICAFSVARFFKELRQAPPTAMFGLVVILIYVMIAATAPIIAPFGQTEVVGSEYEPWGEQFLLGTDRHDQPVPHGHGAAANHARIVHGGPDGGAVLAQAPAERVRHRALECRSEASPHAEPEPLDADVAAVADAQGVPVLEGRPELIAGALVKREGAHMPTGAERFVDAQLGAEGLGRAEASVQVRPGDCRGGRNRGEG